MAAADPAAVAAALGFGPWQKPSQVGRDFVSMKEQLQGLGDAKLDGTPAWCKAQIQMLERKVMIRTPTPHPIGELNPELPLYPPDFWICPRIHKLVADVKELQKTNRHLQAQLQQLAEATNTTLKPQSFESDSEGADDAATSSVPEPAAKRSRR